MTIGKTTRADAVREACDALAKIDSVDRHARKGASGKAQTESRNKYPRKRTSPAANEGAVLKHVLGGNCWVGVRHGDVCKKHEQPRGECDECPRCPACIADALSDDDVRVMAKAVVDRIDEIDATCDVCGNENPDDLDILKPTVCRGCYLHLEDRIAELQSENDRLRNTIVMYGAAARYERDVKAGRTYEDPCTCSLHKSMRGPHALCPKCEHEEQKK